MPIDWSLCQICGEPLVDEYTSRMEGTLLEQFEKCAKGHYFYSFAYGHTEICVGEEAFGSSYSDTPEEHRKFLDEVKAAIAKAKEAYESVPR